MRCAIDDKTVTAKPQNLKLIGIKQPGKNKDPDELLKGYRVMSGTPKTSKRVSWGGRTG